VVDSRRGILYGDFFVIRFILCAALGVSALTSTAFAGTPPPAPKGPVNLSHARCENPKVIARIKEELPNFQLGGGRAFMSNYLGDNSNLTATTISATQNELVCRIMVTFHLNGGDRSVPSRWIVMALPDGGVRETLDPSS